MPMPVVLVHRAGGCKAEWAEVCAELDRGAPGIPFLAIDLPGPGRGGGAPLGSVEAMAGFVAAATKGLGSGPAVVAGHSMGGAVALELALSFPDLAAGLVLVAAGAEMRPGRAVMEAIRSGDLVSHPLLGEAAFSPSLPGGRREDLAARLGKAPLSLLVADMEAVRGFDAGPRLHALRIPVRILAGRDDRLIPLTKAARLRDLAPGSRLDVLEGVGHMIPWEDPAAVARAIADVVHSLARAAAGDGPPGAQRRS